MSNNNRTTPFKPWLTSLLLVSSFLSHNLLAKSSDGSLPMNIEAGNVVMNEKAGTSLYSGNVIIYQGSRQISGETITVHATDSKVNKVIIIGKPAIFKQTTDTDETIEARSEEMIFYADKEQLVLLRDAVLSKQDNVFRSDKIIYDTAKDIISAGDQTGSDEQRVKITIQPKNSTSQP